MFRSSWQELGNGVNDSGEPSLAQVLAAMEHNRHEATQNMERNIMETAQVHTRLLEQIATRLNSLEYAPSGGTQVGSKISDFQKTQLPTFSRVTEPLEMSRGS